MLLYVSIFTVLLSLLLFYNNWNTNKNAAYLSLFLIFSSIYGMAHYFAFYGKSPFWLAIFYNHFTPLMLLLGPLLLFYVRGTLNDTSRLNEWDIVHFIPAVIQLLGIVPYSLRPFNDKLKIASSIINNIDTIITVDTNYFYDSTVSFILRPVLLLSYIIYCMYLIGKRFSFSKIDQRIPQKQLFLSLRWLLILIVSLFFIVIEFLIITYNSINIKPSIGLINSYPLYILSGAAYFIMSFSLLLFPNILYGIPKRTINSSVKSKKDKNPKSKLIENSIEEDPFYDLSLAIKDYLIKEKPFLHPEFSISDIALQLQVPQNHVSYCVNNIMKIKFASLKSELRIAYVIDLLTGDLNEAFTIEGIAQQSGFKSRASFYNAFKEKTGITPTEFITMQKENRNKKTP